jgi:3,4-dihydroxy 2-butanone 4-phosphate synthase/GTP cyclohydrolase II
MVNANNAPHSTAFTVSIEAARGVTTGISAADRAQTIRSAVAPDARRRTWCSRGMSFR